MKTRMNIALKGIGMIAIASSVFFTSCGSEDTTSTSQDNIIAPAPGPVDTISADPNTPVDTVKASPADSVKK